MSENRFICSFCRKSKLSTQRIPIGTDVLCYACAEEYTTLCDHCGERVYRRDARQVNSRTICPQCCGQVLKKSH